MTIDIKVPVFSESVSEGTLIGWHKKVGDAVRRGDLLIDIETDKVVLEVTAISDGVLTEILKAEGATVVSEEVIAKMDTSAQAVVQEVKAPEASPKPEAVVAETFSPAVRKLIAENDVQPQAVTGTGKGGRLTKGDVLGHLEQQSATAVPTQQQLAVPSGARPQQRVPMTRIRARIAQRLKEVQSTAAILTTFNEINMAPVMELRKRYQEAFVKKHGVKLGFMGFFVRAATEALKAFPVINASVDGQDIIYHGYFDIGIAVSSERGLVVPILRDTDTLGLAQIEQGIAAYANKAKDGKLTLEDMSGGTFSITNGGTFGSMLSTPILNQPQSAILGMHNIVERAVVENGQIVARPVMYVALSYDHRIIDGKDAVSFLVMIKQLLEDPARFVLDV